MKKYKLDDVRIGNNETHAEKKGASRKEDNPVD